MIRGVLQFADLQDLCKPGKKPKPLTVERWLRRQGIAFGEDAVNGLWTTVDALNVALGVKVANDEQGASYSADDV